MKRRFIYSVFFLLSLGLGIGLASTRIGLDRALREQPVAAQGMTSSNDGPVNINRTDQTTLEGHASSLDVVANPQPTVEGFPSLASAFEMVENLNNKALSQLPVGWMHLREEKVFDTDAENNGVLPNGVAIPNHQINDIWYRLDASHHVVESVTIMRTAEGEIVQVGVYSNGTGWNSATEVTEPSEPTVLNALDGQFLWGLKKLGESSHQPQIIEEMSTDGIRFVIKERFDDNPMQLMDYKLPVIQAETRATFDQEKGYLLSKEVVFQFLDGSERASQSLKQEITFEKPTEEALSYIAKKEAEATK